MNLHFKRLVDRRTTPSRTTPAESIEVSLDGTALLAEVPHAAGTTIVTVEGQSRTVVTGVPAAGQVRIATSGSRLLPILQFHASDVGLTGTCDYYRTGSIITGLHWDALREWGVPIQGYDDLQTLTNDVPPTQDIYKRGFPGDKAILSGGIAYSDGNEWKYAGVTDYGELS